MSKSPIFSTIALGAILMVGGIAAVTPANAAPPCPPGAQCGPGNNGGMGGMHKPKPPSGNQQGQNNNGDNMDWKHHRRHHGHSGADFGVGIYLGDGYNNGYYGRRNYVSCGEARGIVRANGFRNVRTQSCAPGNYRFLGSKRGAVFAVVVSGRGRIIAVNRW
ncbi:MAG TPA: hypothetical protein VLK33_18555 [Terriglobales bacterium]|nr:hypothetical protein [Terriglobales bacterium]